MKDIIKTIIQMLGFAFVFLFTFCMFLLFIGQSFASLGIDDETLGCILVLSALVVSMLVAFAFLFISYKFLK